MIDQPLKLNDVVPLETDPKSERLRADHARLDLLQAMIHPEQADQEWQVETITDWTTKTHLDDHQVMLKVTWIGGDKQWVSVDNMRLHDLYLVVKYAIRNKLTDKPGFEWTKKYLEGNITLTNMVHAYKASRFLKNIKFGTEVPQSTRYTLKIDKADGTNLWKQSMNTEINPLSTMPPFLDKFDFEVKFNINYKDLKKSDKYVMKF